jgi:hypothetical protein
MLAIKKARKTDRNQPQRRRIPRSLLRWFWHWRAKPAFSVAQLYQLDNKRFELALEILDEWRLDRHYASKLRLIDSSSQVKEMGITLPNTLVNEST